MNPQSMTGALIGPVPHNPGGCIPGGPAKVTTTGMGDFVMPVGKIVYEESARQVADLLALPADPATAYVGGPVENPPYGASLLGGDYAGVAMYAGSRFAVCDENGARLEDSAAAFEGRATGE